MESLWNATAKLPDFGCLDHDIRTDVLIIGGGMAGILCAYEMKRMGVDYVLLEAETICGGITKNTTAKITSQHGLIYDKLLRSYGIDKARMYFKSNQEALSRYRTICKEIDCGFEEKDAYVYTLDHRNKIEKELNALTRIGVNAEFTDTLPLPLNIAGAIRFEKQAQFHPLKFISHIARELRIYEHTKVWELIGTTAVTDRGRVQANQIIIATHFPFLNKHGSYFMKLYQHRSYVIALENAPDVGGMYVDEAKDGMSFRNYENLLLIGGGDHRTGKKGGGWDELRRFAALQYPAAREVYHWATQDCMSLDGIPYIGRYSASTENLYVATGFNKWGMTSSMVSAMVLSDMVQGKENPYASLYLPSRSVFHPQLAANAAEAVINLLTPSTPRCPHLGCALKWNAEERTWDCPCHGSRFFENGELIDNPSAGNLKPRE